MGLLVTAALSASFDACCLFVFNPRRYGNVGRFLNHSCDPNLGKQAVYVDAHDLRAPHLAFFALEDIPAMQELTWDYGYKEGSVSGKTMPCHCGAAECGGVMY